MKESYGKDPASHSDPESCVGDRKGAGEALTGAHAGQPSSCEIRRSGVPMRLMLLCHLSGYPLWHAHELTQQRLLGRFEPEPVADLAMHLRQGHATPVRPRGKKPAAGAPGGLAPAAAAI